jgi:hypothetical protein
MAARLVQRAGHGDQVGDEVYDSKEWFFPGSQDVDGTIEGALRAGREAYPC